MSDRVIVRRASNDEMYEPASPGSEPAYGNPVSDGRAPCIRCGQCGQWSAAAEGHRVDADGIVSPSWWHDVPGCGWHVWLELENWSGGSS